MTDPGTGQRQDDYFQDPQRVFARMRESRPVTRVNLPRGRAWLVTRYADVRAALRPRLRQIATELLDAVDDATLSAHVPSPGLRVRDDGLLVYDSNQSPLF